MPFEKSKGGEYKSPSGKAHTEQQVRMYFATDGFKKKPKKKAKGPGGKK